LAREHGPQDSTVTKQEFLAALDEARIRYEDFEIPVTDQQSAIRIVDTGVAALFGLFDKTKLITQPGNYLISVSKDFEKEIS
jgi:hypothetical protein